MLPEAAEAATRATVEAIGGQVSLLLREMWQQGYAAGRAARRRAPNPRPPSKVTPERRRLIRDMYAVEDVRMIHKRVNDLPGPPVTLAHIYTAAREMGLRRPAPSPPPPAAPQPVETIAVPRPRAKAPELPAEDVAALVARHAERHGITHCPPAASAETTAEIPASARSELAAYAARGCLSAEAAYRQASRLSGNAKAVYKRRGGGRGAVKSTLPPV